VGGVFPLTHVYILDLLITYFWFVGITNAVNMLDNMDGLASGVVIVAGVTIVILALPTTGTGAGGVLAVPLGLVFVAALVGFWLHNRPIAAIFMGDSGSLCIGYVLAALAVPSPLNGFMGIRTAGSVLGPLLALLIPATVVAIPIFDTTFVTITRTWRAQKASQGGRDHSSHRLVGLGLSEKKAVWVLYILAAFGGTIAILLQRFANQSLPLFGLFGLILVLTGVYLGHVKMQTVHPQHIPPTWTPLVTNFLYKRHAAEVLMDTVLIVLCFYSAYLLRFEGVLSPSTLRAMMRTLPLVVLSCLLAYGLAGIYRGHWRLISVPDLPAYGVGVSLGTVLSLSVVLLLSGFAIGHSHSVYVIFGLLLFLALIGSRLSFRLFDVLCVRQRSRSLVARQKPVLIYGAGRAGKLLYEEAMFSPRMQGYVVIGFIDDNPHSVGRKLCGVPVRHGWEWREQVWARVPEIWVSSRFIPEARVLQFAAQWQEKAVVRRLKLEMVPPLADPTLVPARELSRPVEPRSPTLHST
jgi:UDP-GlcNAc:undecaprenyl-phosphate GlcNAc-1-phosphate transferase